MSRDRIIIVRGNVRQLIGHLIGKRLVDITQDDPQDLEQGDQFIQLMFEDGNWLKFYLLDSEHYQDLGPLCFNDPEVGSSCVSTPNISDDDLYTPSEAEKRAGRWTVIELECRGQIENHIVPIFGRQHYVNLECWCKPKLEDTEDGELIVKHKEKDAGSFRD